MENVLRNLLKIAGYKEVNVYEVNWNKQEDMFWIWYWINHDKKTYAIKTF